MWPDSSWRPIYHLRDEEGFILIHSENETQTDKDFARRMLVYFAGLYEKYRRRILPIAIFSYDEEREEPDFCQRGFPFLNVPQFRFFVLELRKENWREMKQIDQSRHIEFGDHSDEIRAISDILVSKIGAGKIYLFGSYANGMLSCCKLQKSF